MSFVFRNLCMWGKKEKRIEGEKMKGNNTAIEDSHP